MDRVVAALAWLWNITNPKRNDDEGADASAMISALVHGIWHLPAQCVIDAIEVWPGQPDGKYWPSLHDLVRLSKDYEAPRMVPYLPVSHYEPSAAERARVLDTPTVDGQIRSFEGLREWFAANKPERKRTARPSHLRDDDLKRARLAAGTAGYFYTRDEYRHLLPPDPIEEASFVGEDSKADAGDSA